MWRFTFPHGECLMTRLASGLKWRLQVNGGMEGRSLFFVLCIWFSKMAVIQAFLQHMYSTGGLVVEEGVHIGVVPWSLRRRFWAIVRGWLSAVRIEGVPSAKSCNIKEADFMHIEEHLAELRWDDGTLQGWRIVCQAVPAEWRIIDCCPRLWGREQLQCSLGLLLPNQQYQQCSRRNLEVDLFFQKDLVDVDEFEIILLALQSLRPVYLRHLFALAWWRSAALLGRSCCRLVNKLAWSARWCTVALFCFSISINDVRIDSDNPL